MLDPEVTAGWLKWVTEVSEGYTWSVFSQMDRATIYQDLFSDPAVRASLQSPVTEQKLISGPCLVPSSAAAPVDPLPEDRKYSL